MGTSSWYSETKPSVRTEEKVTNLHFYFHDIRSGDHPTAVQIAGPEDFGALVVQDDPLTEGPERSSKEIGRAQGFYVTGDQNEFALVMALSYVFTDGKYNGSTLSFLTRNPIMYPVRELAVVGGTGIFRRASGYALLNTVWFDVELKDAVVEYDVTVYHY